jgi:hypothetical protein
VVITTGETRYFQPVCPVMTERMVIDVTDLSGSSSLYVSTKDKNPGPFDYELRDETPGRKHLVIKRGSIGGGVFIGVVATACAGTAGETMVHVCCAVRCFVL